MNPYPLKVLQISRFHQLFLICSIREDAARTWIALEAMRQAKLLTHKGLWMLDHGVKAIREASMAKSISPQIGIEACNNAMITFGHVGYSSEYVVEQRFEDAYGFEFADGTADIQKVVVVRDSIGTEYRACA